uniref:Uncharacterized protein n=1 Tax=Anguilla anguilla TaxID=7936 RepID=A0A0E9PI92_ANGAN
MGVALRRRCFGEVCVAHLTQCLRLLAFTPPLVHLTALFSVCISGVWTM